MATVAIALSTEVAGELIVKVFLGHKYENSVPLLKTLIWSNIFLFWLVAQGVWDVLENMTRFALVKTCLCAALNITLNAIFIPHFQAMACVYSALVTYFFAAVGFNLFHPKTRFLLKQQVRMFFEFKENTVYSYGILKKKIFVLKKN
ncbi:hypothetical protein [Bdellovibrio bacteriovorus]|uniref:hypothetical protein n=1 Tax=Bdellovibrio bacteriovorus TaxID=959 RepID=UPI0035A601A2